VARRWVALLILAGLVFIGCGAADRFPPVLPPTPLQETVENTDNVVVSFRVEVIEEFQSTEFRFNGSVRNTGDARPNARFEVLATKNIPDPNGKHTQYIIAVQPYGTLLTSQTQPISLVAVLPNVDNSTVTGRFAHD
jgi:hypothetical protein